MGRHILRRSPLLFAVLALLFRPVKAAADSTSELTLLVGVPIAADAHERRGILRSVFRRQTCRGALAVFAVDAPSDPALYKLLRLEQEVYNDILFLSPGDAAAAAGAHRLRRSVEEFLRLAKRVAPPHPYGDEFDFVAVLDDETYLHVPNLLSLLEALPRERLMLGLGGGDGRGGSRGPDYAIWEETTQDPRPGDRERQRIRTRAGAGFVYSMDIAETITARTFLDPPEQPAGASRGAVGAETGDELSTPDYVRDVSSHRLTDVVRNGTTGAYDHPAWWAGGGGGGGGSGGDAAAVVGASREELFPPDTLAVRRVETREMWAHVVGAFSLTGRASPALSHTARRRCTRLHHHDSVQPRGTLPPSGDDDVDADEPVPFHLPRRREERLAAALARAGSLGTARARGEGKHWRTGQLGGLLL